MAPSNNTCAESQTRGENKGAKTLKRETNNGGKDDHFPGHLHSTGLLKMAKVELRKEKDRAREGPTDC
jgi:hypothetical protein